MKRFMLHLLMLFLLLYSASTKAETGWSSEVAFQNNLTVYGSDVYVLSHWGLFFFDQAIIYRVGADGPEKVYSGSYIENIYTHHDGIVMERTLPTLESTLAKMLAGNRSLEIFDPHSSKVTAWDRYSPDHEDGWHSFAQGKRLYKWLRYTDKMVLEEYLSPGVTTQVLQTNLTGFHPRSFILVAAETDWLFKNRVRLTIFDANTQQYLQTDRFIQLQDAFESPSDLQAVLQNGCLYYLSSNSLRMYDFENQIDSEVLAFPFPVNHNHSFALADDWLILTEGSEVKLYSISEKSLLKTLQSSISNMEYLIQDSMLYLYDPYDMCLACIDLLNWTQAIWKFPWN